ncbi:hypothetical protein GmHk_05G013529 [Glycine max]|nr:hypothetical protein GmHk_05G013529 [Glycine max]
MFLLFELIHSACLKLGHLTLFHEQTTVSPAKPPQKPNPKVDDLLYLMTLTIPELFWRPYQVTWDATMFGVFNPDFPLYIKHEDLSKIAHGGQCLNISVLQLWILHLTETSMRAGNSDMYGFLEPQSIQRSGQSHFESESYIKSWMQRSKRDVYLGAYLNGGHWQMVVIVPNEHLVVWFCSLHNRLDNYLKGIINRSVSVLHLSIVFVALEHPSPSAVKWTRKASRLRSLSARPAGAERLVVHIDPATGKADGPHRKKLRTYLGIVARDKVDITYENWKEVPTAQKDLIWEDIQAEFEIPEASDSRTKRKLLQTVGERWRQFKSDLTRKWALAPDTDSVDDTNTTPHILSRGGYEYLEQKLLAEKTKKKLEEAAQSGSVDGVIDPPSLVRCHVKWKMARTKKTREMTTEATKEIAEKIDSFEEQATQESFVPHGRQDILTAAIGRPEHPGRVRAAGAGVTIRHYFAADLANQGPARGVHHRKSDEAAHGIVQPDAVPDSVPDGLALPPEPLVGPSGARVSTKGSCVDPSRNDLEADPACLVALGRVYEGSTVVHNTPLLLGQVKVSVEEVTDADAPVPVPTDEVSLVGQALHTFLAWPTHLVKSLSQQVAVSPTKPPPKPDPKVDDPLYLMTLTIPELFLRPYQVTWDATVFGVFNRDFLLYIKHEDLSEIAHGGQCLSISVHLNETSMRAGNSDIYGFLEPQSIQRSGQSQFESESYIKTWMQSSKCDVYLGAYLNGGHWQMVVILPKEHLVVWFYSLHNRPDNYLKGIINSALKGLDDAPQPKSKALARWIVIKCNRQKGSTECGYYVMHWMSTIILGTFRNNWEAYFNDPRPLEPERLKTIGAREIKGVVDPVGTILSPS